MLAVKGVVGREAAQALIKKHAVAEALRIRQGGADDPDRLIGLLADERVFRDAGISVGQLRAIVSEKTHFTGLAKAQIEAVCSRIDALVATYPDQAAYEPEAIL